MCGPRPLRLRANGSVVTNIYLNSWLNRALCIVNFHRLNIYIYLPESFSNDLALGNEISLFDTKL